MQKNLLIYYQNPHRSIFFESLVAEFIARGYNVFFLTKAEPGILQEIIGKMGAKVDCYNPPGARFMRFFYHIRYLVRYCRRNKIDVVYSHLQLANLIALFAQYFIKAKVFPCRHHVDEILIVKNKTAMKIDKAINRMAKRIIVVANAVKVHMVKYEKVKARKITVIPLGYDFNLYAKPNPVEVRKIREKMNCHMLLAVIARMTPAKRHILVMEVLNKLVRDGLDIRILLMDRGPEEVNLRAYLKEHGLEDRVHFTGFLNNTMDYLDAVDLVLHPSVIEASNQVVKEAAYLGKTCIVCENVGDFNEYITHGENGFLVSKENTVEEMYHIVREFYSRLDDLKCMGEKLRKKVTERFDIKSVTDQYLAVGGLN